MSAHLALHRHDHHRLHELRLRQWDEAHLPIVRVDQISERHLLRLVHLTAFLAVLTLLVVAPPPLLRLLFLSANLSLEAIDLLLQVLNFALVVCAWHILRLNLCGKKFVNLWRPGHFALE